MTGGRDPCGSGGKQVRFPWETQKVGHQDRTNSSIAPDFCKDSCSISHSLVQREKRWGFSWRGHIRATAILHFPAWEPGCYPHGHAYPLLPFPWKVDMSHNRASLSAPCPWSQALLGHLLQVKPTI